MQSQYRLKHTNQFQYVYRRGKSSACKEFVVLYANSRQLKVGFSVSKKVGGAVVRNRIKRRLREVVRPLLPCLKRGSYVIIARVACKDCDFKLLQNNFVKMLKKQNLLKSDL